MTNLSPNIGLRNRVLGVLALAAIVGAYWLLSARQDDRLTAEFRLPQLQNPSGELGKEVTSEEFRGSWLLLNFWAEWCTACEGEGPLLSQLAGTVPLFGILSQDSPHGLEQSKKFRNRRFPQLFDQEATLASSWNVQGFPQTLLIDPKGAIRLRIKGRFEESHLAKIYSMVSRQ